MATGNVFIDTLAGVSWPDVGGDRNIAYYLDDTLGHRPWRAIEAPMFEIALQQWANVANITTQRVSSLADADLREVWLTDAEMQAFRGNYVAFHTLPVAGGPAVGAYNTLYTFVHYAVGSITPGGLGFVEAGLTATLTLAGVSPGDAVLATFVYRLFSYWLALPLGLLGAVLFHRRYAGAEAA